MRDKFNSFNKAIEYCQQQFTGQVQINERWQGTDVSKRPEMNMHEVLHTNLFIHTWGVSELDIYRQQIKPNLPWADDHFEERVCGHPINPGVEWENWPGAESSKNFLNHNGQFNHNYMERYWARYSSVDIATKNVKEHLDIMGGHYEYIRGLRGRYGDLMSLVRDLANDPYTRQAYLPIWFPEDTGDAHSGRKPCTLGYHFIMRNNKLSITYYIRSCDFIRHFRDDLYLTMRLLLWVLQECRKINPKVWNDVYSGSFIMQITSLHMFRNDYMAMISGTQENKILR